MQHRWPERHQKHRREDQEEHREDELDADLPGGFLRLLPHACAQILDVRSQGWREAGFKAVAIDQQAAKLLQLGIAVTGTELFQSLAAAFAGSQLQLRLSQLGRQFRMRWP